jgi:hypothetical protein
VKWLAFKGKFVRAGFGGPVGVVERLYRRNDGSYRAVVRTTGAQLDLNIARLVIQRSGINVIDVLALLGDRDGV